MDRSDIDMMILKRAGIAKLEEALEKKKIPAFVGPYNTTNEPYFVEEASLISIESEITDTTLQDPLVCAIMDRIKFVESRDGGYYPDGHHVDEEESILANNNLGFITKYWHMKREDGTPYIFYKTECDEEHYIKKALQELCNHQ
jgi:hypothetical protein